jgi:hypothetical protein
MILTSLAAVVALGTAEPSSTVATVAECEIALQVVKDLSAHDYGKPIVFDTSDPTYPHLDAERLAKGWTRFEGGKTVEVASPPMQVAAEFVSGIRDSVSRCSSVRNGSSSIVFDTDGQQ